MKNFSILQRLKAATVLLIVLMLGFSMSEMRRVADSLERVNAVNRIKQRYAIDSAAACTTAPSRCGMWCWLSTSRRWRST